MKVSVLIPTFNAAATIQMTLDSVLQQTVVPHEILVLDDGSTDNTVPILKSYTRFVKVLLRKNGGVARARNELCKVATGDLLAFLDHDDLWHPRYLEVQTRNFLDCPHAVGYFTGHTSFRGHDAYSWEDTPIDSSSKRHVISPQKFLRALHRVPGTFVSPSFFCMPRRIPFQLGDKPFCEKVSGADDCYLYKLLVLLGSVVYCPAVLGAYRVIDGAASTNKVEGCRRAVGACELLLEDYRLLAPELFDPLRIVLGSERREYGKRLMGAGRVSEARLQFRLSMIDSEIVLSSTKSLGLLALSYLPSVLQPAWPKPERVVKIPEGAQRA